MTPLELLNITLEQKVKGIWFSGIEGEGEYKEWWDDCQLFKHCFYKNGKLEGEYKTWYDDGQLYMHQLYKNDEIIKDYLK